MPWPMRLPVMGISKFVVRAFVPQWVMRDFGGGEVFAEPMRLSESFSGAGSTSGAPSSCTELGLVA